MVAVVSSLLMNILNSVGVAKAVDPQILIDYLMSSRNNVSKYLMYRTLFKIRMFRTSDSLLVTLIEKKTDLPISQQ